MQWANRATKCIVDNCAGNAFVVDTFNSGYEAKIMPLDDLGYINQLTPLIQVAVTGADISLYSTSTVDYKLVRPHTMH